MNFDHLSLDELRRARSHPGLAPAYVDALDLEIAERELAEGGPRPRRSRRLLKLERDVRREIVAWAYARGAIKVLDFEQGYRLSRCKNCGQELGRRHATTRVEKGLADLYVMWPPPARPWWIECKSETGKQTHEQQEFQRAVAAGGGVYVLARSVQDCEAAASQAA